MPWISPTLSGLEVSLWNKGDTPVIAGGTLPGGDALLLQGTMRGEALRYRLSVVPAKGGPTWELPRGVFAHDGAAEFQGAFAGTPGRTVDLVGRILALAANSGTMAVGRYSRRL